MLNPIITIASLDPLTLEPPQEDLRERLLSFPLNTQGNSLIPLDQITEILRINLGDSLTVPETPSWVIGVYNWRGDMLWLVDLEHLLGYSSLLDQPLQHQPIAIVLPLEGQTVGLVVKTVNDVELHDLQELLPARPGLFPPQVLPFVVGYLPSGATVLNLKAISQFFLWQRQQAGLAGL